MATPHWHDPTWAERVRRAVAAELEHGVSDAARHAWRSNGAQHQHFHAATEDGVAVLFVVYTHLWWTLTTGLRRRIDHDPATAGPPDDPAERLAWDLVLEDIGDPLGTYAESMVPDEDGVWWWGDDPLPGDATQRGPAPRVRPVA